MARASYVLFSVLAYLIFFATFLYLVGFVADLTWLPHTVDRGPLSPPLTAFVIDVALIALFGVQHSGMARRGFKAAWTRLVPEPLERSGYVVFASLALIVLFAFWRPITGDVWRVETPIGAGLLWVLFGLGWLIVLSSTFLLNHFELFGLQQTWLHWRNRRAAAPVLREPLFYRLVRHPLYSGFLIAFWATPRMTLSHLLLAAGLSSYMLLAIRWEERDLVDHFGDAYVDYRRRVGMLAPRLRRSVR